MASDRLHFLSHFSLPKFFKFLGIKVLNENNDF